MSWSYSCTSTERGWWVLIRCTSSTKRESESGDGGWIRLNVKVDTIFEVFCTRMTFSRTRNWKMAEIVVGIGLFRRKNHGLGWFSPISRYLGSTKRKSQSRKPWFCSVNDDWSNALPVRQVFKTLKEEIGARISSKLCTLNAKNRYLGPEITVLKQMTLTGQRRPALPRTTPQYHRRARA